MTKLQHFKKTIVAFFVIGLLMSNMAFSQGPTAPEAASFEPVDATDMVNLVTGDFSYVLPLLEVPSPEGGYALSLSYHSGIALDQEASWVGLGWTVNPGAINRSVSGFPDDWSEGRITSFAYDYGGEINSHDFSIGVGWGEGKYSVGLYGSYVENKAFGGENSYSFNGGITGNIAGIGGRIGSDGIGITYSSKTANHSDPSQFGVTTTRGINYSIGINHSFKTGKSKLNASMSGYKSTSTSYGSADTYSTGSIGTNQLEGIFGSNKASVNSSTQSQIGLSHIPLRIPLKILNINYSFTKIKYWFYDKKSYVGVGTLYSNNFENVKSKSGVYSFAQGFDTYSTPYDNTDYNADFQTKITLPAYDSYSVSGQGISGNISPKIFKYGSLNPRGKRITSGGASFPNNSYNRDNLTSQLENCTDCTYFYFNNANESYLSITSNWGSIPSSVQNIKDIASMPPNKETQTTINGLTYDNYNTSKGRKKGASYIETFTNRKLIDFPSILLTTKGLDRSNLPEDGIGAYKITTSSGKTYHYTLPVYQKEKFTRSSQYDEDIENKFYEEFQLKPYATHWLLTAITGSDYVDNGDGKLSEGDIGYWVEFNYGKWSDGYTWRTPRGTGYKTTNSSKIYEWGVKEIYYLNNIKTRTHTALFVKSERLDNQSILKTDANNYKSVVPTYKVSEAANGAYHIRGPGYDTYPVSFLIGLKSWTNNFMEIKYSRRPHKLLKLDKILILNNKNLTNEINMANYDEPTPEVKYWIEIDEEVVVFKKKEGSNIELDKKFVVHRGEGKGEYYNNILDIKDLAVNYPDLESLADKTIDFNYDYSLGKNTPNRIETSGRLTLKSLSQGGKGGEKLIPAHRFSYNNFHNYDYSKLDDWGYYKNKEDLWSLNEIITPTGAKMNIDYEADDYAYEAAESNTVFTQELKFNFYNVNNKLRIVIKNEHSNNPKPINFLNYFESNQLAKVDIWACAKREFFDLTCKTKTGKIDINNEEIMVISVNQDTVTLETDFSYTDPGTLPNGNPDIGLQWVYGNEKAPDYWGYAMSDSRFQVKSRGECPYQENNCDNIRYAFKYKVFSNKSSDNSSGGGIRVKQITTTKFDNDDYTSKYYYNKGVDLKNKNDNTYVSSGVTSYSPSNYGKDLKFLSELPSPMVMYSQVTVESDNAITKYSFKTLEKQSQNPLNPYKSVKFGDALIINETNRDTNIDIDVNDGLSNKLSKNKYVIHNNLSSLGSLLKIERYNNKSQLLNQSENVYRSFINSENEQGVNTETFNSYTSIRSGATYKNYYLNISSKTTYPSVLESTTEKSDNYSYTTTFDKFDFNTGKVLETTIEDSKGRKIKQEITPAYTIPSYSSSATGSGMGSLVDDLSYKNMLSQVAMTKTYLKDSGSDWNLINANITTWSNRWDYKTFTGDIESHADIPYKDRIWRTHKTYTWDGETYENGSYKNFSGSDDNFNWSVGLNTQQNNPFWKNITTTTLYDHYSMPLEVEDINENHAATKMGDGDSKIMMTSNARYGEAFYSGAEYNIGSNYLDQSIKGSGYRSLDFSHTGKYSLKIQPNQRGFETILKQGLYDGGKYKISVWVKKSNANNARINISGVTKLFNGEKVNAGDWVLLNHYENLSSLNQTLYITTTSGTLYIDDFRMHPIASTMTSYVYNDWDELSHIIGANGLSQYFIYDSQGRLIETQNEVIDAPGITGGFKKTSENSYNYKITQ